MTLTPEMVEIERAAFEADWCTRRPLWRSWAFDRSLDWPNEYASSTVQDCWETWLTRAQSQRAVAVAELDALRTEVRGQAALKDHYQDWDETERMLSALIDRAGGGIE